MLSTSRTPFQITNFVNIVGAALAKWVNLDDLGANFSNFIALSARRNL